MKTGKRPVGRPGVSLQKDGCTDDNLSHSYISFTLFMLPALLRTWWGKHVGLLALEINWSLDLSPQAPDRPCGEVLWKDLEECSGCPQTLQTLREDLVIKHDTAALFANSRTHEKMQLLLLFPLLAVLGGGQIRQDFGGSMFLWEQTKQAKKTAVLTFKIYALLKDLHSANILHLTNTHVLHKNTSDF